MSTRIHAINSPLERPSTQHGPKSQLGASSSSRTRSRRRLLRSRRRTSRSRCSRSSSRSGAGWSRSGGWLSLLRVINVVERKQHRDQAQREREPRKAHHSGRRRSVSCDLVLRCEARLRQVGGDLNVSVVKCVLRRLPGLEMLASHHSVESSHVPPPAAHSVATASRNATAESLPPLEFLISARPAPAAAARRQPRRFRRRDRHRRCRRARAAAAARAAAVLAPRPLAPAASSKAQPDHGEDGRGGAAARRGEHAGQGGVGACRALLPLPLVLEPVLPDPDGARALRSSTSGTGGRTPTSRSCSRRRSRRRSETLVGRQELAAGGDAVPSFGSAQQPSSGRACSCCGRSRGSSSSSAP